MCFIFINLVYLVLFFTQTYIRNTTYVENNITLEHIFEGCYKLDKQMDYSLLPLRRFSSHNLFIYLCFYLRNDLLRLFLLSTIQRYRKNYCLALIFVLLSFFVIVNWPVHFIIKNDKIYCDCLRLQKLKATGDSNTSIYF